jgi:hypothetical protein
MVGLNADAKRYVINHYFNTCRPIFYVRMQVFVGILQNFVEEMILKVEN